MLISAPLLWGAAGGHLDLERLEQSLMIQLAAGDVLDGNLHIVGCAEHVRVQGLRVPLQGCLAGGVFVGEQAAGLVRGAQVDGGGGGRTRGSVSR
jgi:hypothetical protein